MRAIAMDELSLSFDVNVRDFQALCRKITFLVHFKSG